MTQATNRTAVRHTAKPLPFFSYDSAKNPLYSINEGVPFDCVISHASTFAMSMEECSLHAATETDHPSAWAAYYMAQMASALIESLQISMDKEIENV